MAQDSDVDDDQLIEFEERAAILEYDAGISREDAEALAHVMVFGAPAKAK